MRYVLGVDGGNSKTLAVVADGEGTALGVGRSGGSNHQSVGDPAAVEAIRAASDAARNAAGVDAVEAAFFALAGADLPEDFAVLQPALEKTGIAPQFCLENDSMAALLGSGVEGDVVVVSWGAGVVAAGRNVRGDTVRLPALGWYSGDWGGGADLAREAVRLVARAADGRSDPTALTPLVLDALSLPDVDAMISAFYRRQVPVDRLVALAPLVFEAADGGDVQAGELVDRAAAEIAVTAASLLRRLDLLDSPVPVVLSGGVFRTQSSLFHAGIRTHLARLAPRAVPTILSVDPVLGAVMGALRCVGLRTDREVLDRLVASYARLIPSGEGAAWTA